MCDTKVEDDERKSEKDVVGVAETIRGSSGQCEGRILEMSYKGKGKSSDEFTVKSHPGKDWWL